MNKRLKGIFHRHQWMNYGCSEFYKDIPTPYPNNHFLKRICKDCGEEEIIDTIQPPREDSYIKEYLIINSDTPKGLAKELK